LLIAALGEGPLFLLNSISFLPVITGLALIDTHLLYRRPNVEKKESPLGTFRSLQEGLSYIRYTPALLLVIVTMGIVSLFGMNFNVVLPLFAANALKVGPEGYGFISAAFGIGALLGALWLAWKNQQPSIAHIVFSALVFTTFDALFAISHWYLLSLLLITVVGFSMISFTTQSNTILQTMTPDYLRGRITSVYLLVFFGSLPIGNLMVGGLAQMIGISFTFLACALVSILAAMSAWIFRASAEKNVKENSAL
jgi:predicted MFS family arabinose efflux permease